MKTANARFAIKAWDEKPYDESPAQPQFHTRERPALWGLLPEKTDPLPTVPTWPEFLRGCLRYRQSLDEQLPDAPRTDEPYRS